ncbi:GGDEF domain-containing protein [Oxalicibacterium faecigallinarum]|uniref:diguanylate cyclase n=1 Tax=Oxalicibacterium faecigallinarum TaxID=573741 RepID=A0A8J3AS66_9BURK|nr:GGDEF domain-containing protein [Oxalicibacterium faecigallinarum]GGI21592.1 hypothetical protein GCM10008066_29820 [Oxalicibacterium faecigallinarum]
MPFKPPQDLDPLSSHLEALLKKVQDGASQDDIVWDLEEALVIMGEAGIVDPVTGVLNRRGLISSLDAELDRARRTGHTFSIAVISVDGFPQLNMQYGSAVGQQILRGVAQEAARQLRVLDAIGLINEDEFAIILPTTWLDQSGIPLARIARGVAGLDWDSVMPGLNVTLSGGLTPNAFGDTSSTMLARASEALAIAKAKGPGSTAELEKDLPPIDPDLL